MLNFQRVLLILLTVVITMTVMTVMWPPYPVVAQEPLRLPACIANGSCSNGNINYVDVQVKEVLRIDRAQRVMLDDNVDRQLSVCYKKQCRRIEELFPESTQFGTLTLRTLPVGKF